MKMSSLVIMHEKSSQLLLVMPLLIMYSSTILGQTLVPQEATGTDAGIKCGSCPCVNPCGQLPPPPLPPPPPPPAPNTVCCTPLPPPPPNTVCCTPLPPPPPNTVCCTPLPPPPPNTVCCTPLPPPPPNTVCCTPLPPPPPRFVYVTDQPGNLYVADPYDWGFYNGAGQNIAIWSVLLFAFGVVNVVMI